jgi:hypothetical protein
MKPQPLVKLLFMCLLSSGLFLSSCTKNREIYNYPVHPELNTTIPSSINLQLTASASSFDYSKVNVDIQGLEYNVSNEPGVAEGWETIHLEQTGIINLLALVNGNSIRLNTSSVPGNIRQLRIKLGNNNSIEMNGAIKSLSVAEDLKERGLVIFTGAPLYGGYSNALWLNFDATHSVAFNANRNEYELLPVLSPFDASTTGTIEGAVIPANAKATIHLQADQSSRNILLNTTLAVDENNNGYFKVMGLPEGRYYGYIIAGDGTQRTKVITTIEVIAGETKDLGLNTLE